MGFPGHSAGKESACNVGDLGSSPVLGRFLGGKSEQPIPVFLPGESLWTEEPGGLQSLGSQRVRHNWATKHSTFMEYLWAVNESNGWQRLVQDTVRWVHVLKWGKSHQLAGGGSLQPPDYFCSTSGCIRAGLVNCLVGLGSYWRSLT